MLPNYYYYYFLNDITNNNRCVVSCDQLSTRAIHCVLSRMRQLDRILRWAATPFQLSAPIRIDDVAFCWQQSHIAREWLDDGFPIFIWDVCDRHVNSGFSTHLSHFRLQRVPPNHT